jgi:hypothetical protein
MLELFFLYRLCRLLGVTARAQSKMALPYQVLLVVFWVLFEILGFFGALILLASLIGPEGRLIWLVYLMSLLSAGFGALLAFLIMLAVPSPLPVLEFVADEEPRRRFLPRREADPDGIREDRPTDDGVTRG